jgi:Tfp pilus assembly protein PilN
MQAVNLDYLAGKRSDWLSVMVLALGIIGLLLVVLHYRELNLKIFDQEMLVAQLQEQEKSTHILPATEVRSDEQTARETKQVNAAIHQLSLPWKELFAAIETTRTHDVAVLVIEPDVNKGLVNISAEGKKLDSMLDYAASLQKVVLFREVVILNHQVQEQDPEKPIRFVVQAAWERQQ